MSSKASRRDAYHHGDLRRAILDTTIDIIDTRGLDAVSLRGVARRLGVSEAAPYHHFGSKQDLLAALAADSYRGFGSRLETVVAEHMDPWERLKALGRAYIEYGLEKRGRYRLMFGSHMVDLASYAEVVEAGRPTRDMLSTVVAECLDSGTADAETIENAVWAHIHGITSLIGEAEIRPEGSGATSELIETSLSILLAGIQAHIQEFGS